MRCIYCHNSDLVLPGMCQTNISTEDILSFVDKRRNTLQGICISGGEPTLNSDLEDFLIELKTFSLPIKLDTNGLRPDILNSLISKKLIDMVAMDIKAPLERYNEISGVQLDTHKIAESASLIMNSQIDYEFRTTVPSGVFTDSDFKKIGLWLKDARAYYLQAYKYSEKVMCQGLTEPEIDEMKALLSVAKSYIPNTFLRGID